MTEPGGLFAAPSPFLPWVPGETLFSLCSRQHKFWGYGDSGETARLLFGRRRAGTHHDIPNSLDEFAHRTGGSPSCSPRRVASWNFIAIAISSSITCAVSTARFA